MIFPFFAKLSTFQRAVVWEENLLPKAPTQSISCSKNLVTSLRERVSAVMLLVTLHAQYFFYKQFFLRLQSWEKFMKQCNEIKQNWA